MTLRRAAVKFETEAIVEGTLVLAIEDADRAAVIEALADLLVATLEREADDWLPGATEAAG